MWVSVTINQLSARTASLAAAGRVLQTISFVTGWRTSITIEALVHVLAYDVHQLVKHLLHVDIVFGTGLEELEAWRGSAERKQNELWIITE